MPLRVGQLLRGRTLIYHITKVLKDPWVFQARVISLSPTSSYLKNGAELQYVPCPAS
jgi:hypothetical protein